MDHGIGVWIVRIDAERLCQPRAVAGLDRGEAKALRQVPRRDEADPVRAEHAYAVVENHVVVRPRIPGARHRFLTAAVGGSSFSARSSAGPAMFTPASDSASQWPSLPDAAST